MAHHIEVTKRFNVSAKKVWEVLADFSSAERWHFAVEQSPIHDGKTSGLGAKRSCNFYDGTSVVEEIIEYQDEISFRVEISEFAMPLKSLFAGAKVEAIDENACKINMFMDFVVKGGPLGWLMGIMMVKPTMKRLTKKMLNGLAYHAATGKRVGKKLPSQEELSFAFGRS